MISRAAKKPIGCTADRLIQRDRADLFAIAIETSGDDAHRGRPIRWASYLCPLHADTIRLIYRLALEGNGTNGPMGVKNIAAYRNQRRIFTRDGGRWGIGQVHRI